MQRVLEGSGLLFKEVLSLNLPEYVISKSNNLCLKKPTKTQSARGRNRVGAASLC